LNIEKNSDIINNVLAVDRIGFLVYNLIML